MTSAIEFQRPGAMNHRTAGHRECGAGLMGFEEMATFVGEERSVI